MLGFIVRLCERSKMTKRKTINTHYTLETRTIIENRLNEGKRVVNIAREFHRDNSNIAKEINKHISYTFSGTFNKRLNEICLNHDTCNVKSYACYKRIRVSYL